MKRKLKKIYYSEELPELFVNTIFDYLHPVGLCRFIDSREFTRYYCDWSNSGYLGKRGKWNNERLNLICLLIHSLELED